MLDLNTLLPNLAEGLMIGGSVCYAARRYHLRTSRQLPAPWQDAGMLVLISTLILGGLWLGVRQARLTTRFDHLDDSLGEWRKLDGRLIHMEDELAMLRVSSQTLEGLVRKRR